METISVKSRLRDYQVIFHDSDNFIAGLEQLPTASFVIDENVQRLYPQLFSAIDPKRRWIMPVSEENKNLSSVMMLYDFMTQCTAKKNAVIVSVGGGIVQDVSGFAASTLYRGVRWIFVPTTLLAQADSCIGAKTSLNYGEFKNLVGTFYPPHEIHLLPSFPLSQDPLNYSSGVGEIVKLRLLSPQADLAEIARDTPKLLTRDQQTLTRCVRQSLLIKLDYIQEDEFDTGRRNLLNYGHCIGHALEHSSHYAVPHGQAVVVGMILANRLSCNLGRLSPELCGKIEQEILLPVLTVPLKKAYFSCEEILTAMEKDKKRTGEGLAVVMPDNSLNYILDRNVEKEKVRQVIETCARQI